MLGIGYLSYRLLVGAAMVVGFGCTFGFRLDLLYTGMI